MGGAHQKQIRYPPPQRRFKLNSPNSFQLFFKLFLGTAHLSSVVNKIFKMETNSLGNKWLSRVVLIKLLPHDGNMRSCLKIFSKYFGAR